MSAIKATYVGMDLGTFKTSVASSGGYRDVMQTAVGWPKDHFARTYTRQAFETQRQNALAEYFVLYREDFLYDEVELNETGLRHLDWIVRRMNQIGAPIKIEPTGKAELDELRRLKVIDSIVKLAGDPNRVQSGTTRAEGLRSEDITTIGSRFYSTGTGFGSGGGGGGVGGYGR